MLFFREFEELKEKLKKENDITSEEAIKIYQISYDRWFPNNEILSSRVSFYYEWGKVVLQKVAEGYRGNFLTSLRFNWDNCNPKLASCMKPITDKILSMIEPIYRATDIIVSAGLRKMFDDGAKENPKPIDLMIDPVRLGYILVYRDLYNVLKKYVPMLHTRDYYFVKNMCLESLPGLDMNTFLSAMIVKLIDAINLPYITIKYVDLNVKSGTMNIQEELFTDETTAKRLDLLRKNENRLIKPLLRQGLIEIKDIGKGEMGVFERSEMIRNVIDISGPVVYDAYSEILRMEKLKEEKERLIEEDDWMEIDR